jgi:YHS domain-containing protein
MFAFLRILITLLIAISAIRWAVNFVQRLWYGVSAPRNVAGRSDSRNGTATMMQRDPVCGTYVAVDTSLKRIVNGHVMHFCSDECRDRYTV